MAPFFFVSVEVNVQNTNNSGQLASWGEVIIPDVSNTNFTQISADGWHNLALKADGTVISWGRNSYGQVTVPDTLSDVASIASGYKHSLALKSDGTVVAWGADDYGQITVPEGLNDVIAIAAADEHSFALTSDGTDTTRVLT